MISGRQNRSELRAYIAFCGCCFSAAGVGIHLLIINFMSSGMPYGATSEDVSWWFNSCGYVTAAGWLLLRLAAGLFPFGRRFFA
jgi:hypothetical protein